MTEAPCKQTDRIIAKLGNDRTEGVYLLAELAGVSISRAHRWSYPKSRGGTDGIIPAHYHQTILDGARKRGIDLLETDFFEPRRRKRAA